MNTNRHDHGDEHEDDEGNSSREIAPDATALALLVRAEVDSQISTARAFPRKIAGFAREVRELVTLDEAAAASCIYSLPRGKERNADGKMVPKFITGPSARFAEVIGYSFGNNRSGGRVVDVVGNFIIAQGVFHDLEKNVMTTMEVRRRITDSQGRKYNDDMITVTGNAAASIAVRNATLRGIPKALWLPMYEAARMVAVGDLGTLQQRRDKALAWFAHKGVTAEQVLAKLGVDGVEDVGLDELEVLVGISTALRDGSASVDAVFGAEQEPLPAAAGAASARNAGDVAKAIIGNGKPAAAPPQHDPAPERHRGPSLVDVIDEGTGEVTAALSHPLADAMRAAKKRDDLDALADRAIAELEKGPLRTFLTKTLYDEQLARIERELGAL
jgi:hypothetical protein